MAALRDAVGLRPASHHIADMVADAARSTEKPCPICGKPAEQKYRPFCCRRCADVDLNRWLSGVYAVPVTEAEDEDGASSAGLGDEP